LSDERPSIRAWLRDYADHLETAVPLLQGGEQVPETFLPACQDFDTALRQFDVATLREELATVTGRQLMARLDAAKARFEAAVDAHHGQLEEQLRELQKGRTALRGYADAADHQRLGSIYIEKLY
jgi:hypothetical protein